MKETNSIINTIASKVVILLSSKLNSKWTDNFFGYLYGKDLCTAKICNYLRLYFSDWKSEEQILVYQMGKVGSMTVTYSLKALGGNYIIYHVHFFESRAFRLGRKLLL